MLEKRIEHERYLACSLYLMATESPKGTFQSQAILNKVKAESVHDSTARAVFKVCSKIWNDGKSSLSSNFFILVS